MQYYHWVTDYMLYQKQVSKKQRKPYDDFLKWRLATLKKHGIPPVRHSAEVDWVDQGQPYYNIHPKIVSKLCKMDLSKIPSSLLKMPHGLKVVNIRFAQQHPEFTVTEEQSNVNATIPRGVFLRSVLMALSVVNGQRSVAFITDFGVFNSHNQPSYIIFGMPLREDQSMLDTIQSTSCNDSKTYNLMIQNILKLSISIGFLADNPIICEADVLADDRQRYAEGTNEDRQFLAERARRRGKFGFNVGTDLMFLGERPKEQRQSATISGRELEYAHIRAGHPHAVRYGEGKRLVKIMWYVPVTVRGDLPFKSE